MINVYDTSKLRGRIIEKFGSQTAFAKAVHRPKAYVSQYLNGKVCLDQKTIDDWSIKLEILGDDICAYFFTKRVHETEQEGKR